jgi:hypothetical protein
MYVMNYASMLRCWQLIWILVKTNHPCLRVGCHIMLPIVPLISKQAIPYRTRGGTCCLVVSTL